MNDLRRVPVIAPSGKKLILVINGSFIDGMEDGFVREAIPIDAVVAVEECPDDIHPGISLGWKPELKGEIPSLDQSDSDPHPPLH